MKELTAHPYYSRKNFKVKFLGKPGTGIHLLKENGKTSQGALQRKTYMIGKRLSA
jgi:hypothetical protein